MGATATSKDPNIGFYFIFGLCTYFVWCDLSFFGELSEQGVIVRNDSKYQNTLQFKTVKLRMQDHGSHYIFLPFCQWFDETFEFSSYPWVSPNLVTTCHFILALIACRLFMSPVLMWRRVGVVLYELRSMLDILDGVVYRSQSHSKSFKSGFGTFGYLMDASADIIGGIFLLIATAIRLNRYPPLRFGNDYLEKAKKDEESDVSLMKDIQSSMLDDSLTLHNVKRFSRKIVNFTLLFGALQVFCRSGLWDHFLHVYNNLLENPLAGVSPAKQAEVLNYRSTWLVMWLWKINSGDAFTHYVLISIFCNGLWRFIRIMMYIGPALIAILAVITQLHIMQVRAILGVS